LGRADQNLVLGTAGHIDHGKTELVRALTGVDADRLPEEKARGITITLGFAPLELADGTRASLVDVPGHESLVRTMVSGATGIDVVLLVVAADEGVMPQTREHVAICELLGIERGVVALTKCDLVDDEMSELAAEEVADLLAETSLARAPIVRVSALTGEGIDALRETLSEALGEASARTPRSGPPRLCVDRCFAAKGFGCVVTGTLIGAAFALGDSIALEPRGLRGKVRGIQNHGVTAERGVPGLRCALNLQGVEKEQVSRGDVVTRPDALAPTLSLDVELHWLASAPASQSPTHVEFLAGTSERRARVAALGNEAFAPGEARFARIHLDGEPVPLLPGDRFVLRGFARSATSGSTVGGGTVLDVSPPRRRLSDPTLASDLAELARRDPTLDVHVRIRRAGLAGLARARLARETGLAPGSLDGVLTKLSQQERACDTSDDLWLDADALAELERRLLAALDAYHVAEPIRPGMPTGTLRGALPENVPRAAATLALERLEQRGEIRLEEELARRSSHQPLLGEENEAAIQRLAGELKTAGLDPPAPRDLGERLALAPEGLRDLLAHLERQGTLVRAGELWFDGEAIATLREKVISHLREHGTLETRAYKDLIGTTRRAAMPLMELFDAERVTMRRGNARVLRGG